MASTSVYFQHLKNDYSLEKKQTQGQGIISAQFSQGDMDSALNGSSMNGEVTCQDYLKETYMLKGNNYSHGRQV